MDPFGPMLDFVTSCRGHLEQYCLTKADLPNAVAFHFKVYSKLWSLKTPLISLEKLKYWHLVADANFQKFEFLLESSNFINDSKYSVIFLAVTGTRGSLLIKCFPNIQVWIINYYHRTSFKQRWFSIFRNAASFARNWDKRKSVFSRQPSYTHMQLKYSSHCTEKFSWNSISLLHQGHL